MAKRKAISKRVRFEIFKRDSFKCQYCGSSAPEATLHVDHIKPVSKGGDNEMVNLVTSCDSCNLGKSDKELSDNSAVVKQKDQLDAINDKREQLEMMLKWRESMKSIDDDYVDAIVSEINEYSTTRSISDHGRKSIKSWLKKYSLNEIFEAIEKSANSKFSDKDLDEGEHFSAFIESIPKLCSYNKIPDDKKKIFYIKGILRNRVHLNEKVFHIVTDKAVKLGASLDGLQDMAKETNTWSEYKNALQSFIDSREEELRNGES
jgi:hypothetical protein